MRKTYNWKLLEKHAKNYDGTCRFCGGQCQCREAVMQRKSVKTEFSYLHNKYLDSGLDRKEYNRYKYLEKRIGGIYVCTYRMVDR